MPTYHFDFSAATNGTGSLANPFNTFSGVTTVRGDTLLFRTGVVVPSGIPQALLNPGLITVAEYGTGDRPVFDAGVVISPTASPSAGVFQHTLGSNIGGNVLADGQPMTFVPWTTDLASTAALMTAGSFSFDFNTGTLYIRPAGGTVVGTEFKASTIANVIHGVGSDQNRYMNLEVRQASKHAFVHDGGSGVTLENCIARFSGGFRDTGGGFYAGNGFQIGDNAVDYHVIRCAAYDTFDSGFTSQLYGGQLDVQVQRNHVYDDCESHRCGYSSFEFATLSPMQSIRGVYVHRPVSRGAGFGWAERGSTNGHALSLNSGSVGRGVLDRVIVDSPDFDQNRYGLYSAYVVGGLRVQGSGRITGNQTAAVYVEQLGSPTVPRAVVRVANSVAVDGVINTNGYPASYSRF